MKKKKSTQEVGDTRRIQLKQRGLSKFLYISVSKLALATGTQPTTFRWKSPVHVQQRRKPKMSFVLPKMPCNCLTVKANDDFTFTLKIDSI